LAIAIQAWLLNLRCFAASHMTTELCIVAYRFTTIVNKTSTRGKQICRHAFAFTFRTFNSHPIECNQVLLGRTAYRGLFLQTAGAVSENMHSRMLGIFVHKLMSLSHLVISSRSKATRTSLVPIHGHVRCD